MLQQTQYARVLTRWQAWLDRWPTVESLAAAARADVIRAWDGLGYNRRAVNLHKAAQSIADHGWPDDLTELPGVGRYTADAVASRCFEAKVLPVDVNVRRVLERSGLRVRPRVRACAYGPRCDGLHRACPALRCVPARSGLPVARAEVRACAPAGTVRGLVPPAPCTNAAARRRKRAPKRRAGRRGRRGSRRGRPRRGGGRAGAPARGGSSETVTVPPESRWRPRCGVLGRPRTYSTRAPCVLASRPPARPGDEHRSTRPSYRTGQLTTMGMALIDTWPALAARWTAAAERSTRAVCPFFHVTSRTAQSGV